MPIYEYQCQNCRHRFEEIQKLSDPPVSKCPKCDGSVNRLISQTSFALKGEGWYKDGYVKPAPVKTDAAKPADTKAADAKPAEGSAKKDTAAAPKPAAPATPSKGD